MSEEHEKLLRKLEEESLTCNREQLPWDDPNSNPLQDIKDALEKAKSNHKYEPFKPWLTQEEVETLEAEGFNVDRGQIQIIPEGYDVQMTELPTLEQVKEKYAKEDSIAIVSGGLDSTTLVYHMLNKGYKPHLLSFNYGQRHKKELTYAHLTAMQLGLRHDIVDLTGITHLISNSALTSLTGRDHGAEGTEYAGYRQIEVPDGHYAEDTMKATVVPNRNMIMLSIAAGIAVNNGYRCIATGVHSGDHFIYPDCRPRFIKAVNASIAIGNAGFGNIPEQHEGTMVTELVYAPFLELSKEDIAYEALKLNVPLHLTWSCYKGGENHCGRCGTCVERLEAIYGAQQRMLNDENYSEETFRDGWIPPALRDMTTYDDNEFWKVAIRESANK